MERHHSVLVSILLTLMLSRTFTSAQNSATNGESFSPRDEAETFRNLVIVDSNILLGSTNALYQLDITLQEQQRRTLTSPNRLLLSDQPDGNYQNRILSCNTDECFLAEIANLTSVSWRVQPGSVVIQMDEDNAFGVLAPGATNGVSDLTIGETSNGQESPRIFKGTLLNVDNSNNFGFDKQAERTELAGNTDSTKYLTEFVHNGLIYFVVRSSDMITRVVRICQNDTGGVSIGTTFVSHFELELQCNSSPNRQGSLATAAAFKETPSGVALLISVSSVMTMDQFEVGVCAFDIDTINSMMSQKFRQCLRGDGMVGFERDDQLRPCPSNEFSEEVIASQNECFLVGALRPGLEVDEELTTPSLLSLNLSRVEFVSMTVASLDGQLFLFAGTNNATLFQFHVTSPTATTSTFIRAIPLDLSPLVMSRNITSLETSNNGEYIFAMTNTKLFRHSVDQCNTFTSCDSCTTSNDPICGWCALSGTCTRRSTCGDITMTSSPIWETDRNKCPVITSVDPSVIYFQELEASFLVTFQTNNIESTPLSSFDYNCVFTFNGRGTPVTSLATMSGVSFTCRTPTRAGVPGLLANEDTIDMDMALRIRDNVISNVDIVSLETPIAITNCSVQQSCTGCINTAANRCRWCPFSFQCIPDKAGFQCATPTEATVGYGATCPQILPHPTTTNYLVHVNYTYPENIMPLRITATGLTTFQNQFDNGQFKCHICDGDGCNLIFNANLTNEGTEIQCVSQRFDTMRAVPQIDARLKVVWNNDQNIDNPQNVKVSLYSCPYLGTNCAQCLSIASQYSCSYCDSDQMPAMGSCNLDQICQDGSPHFTLNSPSQFGSCDRPQITDFSPKMGPTNGGTVVVINGVNLGAKREDIRSVMIDGVSCNITEYNPGVSIRCVTGPMNQALITDNVRIDFSNGQTATSADQFMFLTPTISIPPTSPTKGPASGGTRITVQGTNLGIGSNHRVFIKQSECDIEEVRRNEIVCVTPSSDEDVANALVRVEVDNWSLVVGGFNYITDPTFDSIRPAVAFKSGGTNYTVTGTNLDSVQEPHLLFYLSVDPDVILQQQEEDQQRRKREVVVERFDGPPCDIGTSEQMTCMSPPLTDLNGSSSANVTIGLLMDGVTDLLRLNATVVVYDDPTFSVFESEQELTGDNTQLLITGKGFRFTRDQVRVLVTPCRDGERSCDCDVIQVHTGNNTLVCKLSDNHEGNTPLTVTVVIGLFSTTLGTVRVTPSQSTSLLIILIPVFAAILVLSASIFIVLVAVFCRKARQKDRKYEQLILELERLESTVAKECKIGFAELQTDLDELTGDMTGCRLPYHNIQTYLLATLFPGMKEHPVLYPLQRQHPSYRQAGLDRIIHNFGDLVNDKKTLLIIIRSMEEQRGFTIRDKSNVGSLLVVALHVRMDYLTDVLKSLLAELIRKTVANSYPKLLLRRTESVAERILTNWLAFCLHGYLMEHSGQPMYLLYRAVKNQLEKGPIDVVTGEARYSLSEQKLIRQKVDVEVIEAFVEGTDGSRIPVKLLDCDTISQAKEKLLDALFKAAPVSQRPKLTAVDLEYIKSPVERMLLRDEDFTTAAEAGWRKINTLRHYHVESNAVFRIIQRREHPGPGKTFDYPASLISSHMPRQRALSEAEDGTRVWHLFKQVDMEDPKRSPFLNKKLVTEIYLPRMLSTKSILQTFVDDLFRSLFTISHPPSTPTTNCNGVFPMSPGIQVPVGYAPGGDAVPMAVKYLFDFLDDEAENAKIADPHVIHTWKNNALSLRFWVNMIKNPEFIFDINKSHTVDACLSVLAQAFIDGCSSADTKLTIDSPTSKLLYNKEVQGYKEKVKQYYHDVRELPRIPEDAMQIYLRQLSTYQSQQMRRTGGFYVDSALYELLRYGSKYSEPILNNLRLAGLESKAQVFEDILRVFNSQ